MLPTIPRQRTTGQCGDCRHRKRLLTSDLCAECVEAPSFDVPPDPMPVRVPVDRQPAHDNGLS